jgi:hypothetical protein
VAVADMDIGTALAGDKRDHASLEQARLSA